MVAFVHDLIESGRVVVPLVAEPLESSTGDLDLLLRQIDSNVRLELAFNAPPLSTAAAKWALQFIENACRFLVYRELDEKLIAERFKASCPGPPSVDRSYSVDLFLRYLPDITRMARGIGESDPLVQHLLHAAAQWPLSSVGIAGLSCDPDEIERIMSDRSLCQLYVDRIIQRRDTTRLEPVAVRDAIRIALGAHSALAPEIARAVENYQEQK